MQGAEEVDAAIQEISANFETLLQTHKSPNSDSGKGTKIVQAPVIKQIKFIGWSTFYLLGSDLSSG